MIDIEKAENAIRMLLEAIGENPNREGLLDTPKRVAKMYSETLAGYEEDASVHLSKIFTCEDSELVLEKDIIFHSLCEHHMLPFFGKVHIAYIPNDQVVGLSKLARVVDVYARRLQIQEQLCKQIASSVFECLNPKGVMVIVEAEHTCMTMRGIKKYGSKTVTISTYGTFRDDILRQKYILEMLKV
ncbi:MAG TPA: GTP cyclohydrolase I FolE [Epulopiscium sp.]|nr:GTP cyclohydrolase I FolE [Candidatus Epulonipiscium sp.]